MDLRISILALEDWLEELRKYFIASAPDLLFLFDIYAAEARFGLNYIFDDLAGLPSTAKILEIGAGTFMLTTHLKREGFCVTGLEPVGNGFNHFTRMRSMVLERAAQMDCMPILLETSSEELNIVQVFDYSFSINVMEHVNNVEKTVTNVIKSLKPGSVYRFTCPNYTFPYEPHFNIPTFFSKALTKKLFWSLILSNNSWGDPAGLWASLNWITVSQLQSFAKSRRDLDMTFKDDFIVSSFERMVTDRQFAARRSFFIQKLILFMVQLKLHKWLRYIPISIQPIIDCCVYCKYG